MADCYARFGNSLDWYARLLSNPASRLQATEQPPVRLTSDVLDRLSAIAQIEGANHEALIACLEATAHLTEIGYRMRMDRSKMELALSLAKQLVTRAQPTGEDREAFAVCLANCTQAIFQQAQHSLPTLRDGKRETVRILLSELSDYEQEEPDSRVAWIYGSVVCSAMAAAAVDEEWVRPLYEKSLDLVRRYPDEIEVLRVAAGGLLNATTAASFSKDWEWVGTIHKALESVLGIYPHDEDLATSLGKSLAVAWSFAVLHEDELRAAVLEESATGTGNDVVIKAFRCIQSAIAKGLRERA